MDRRTRLTAVITAFCLILPAAVPRSASAAGPPMAWQPCADVPALNCATLTVPIDWSRRRGPALDLALVRKSATDPTSRVGVLLWNPGGPGGEAVRHLKAGDVMSAEIHRRFDVVTFDPRGVGLSQPVECDAALDTWPMFEVPATAGEFERLRVRNRAYGDSCRRLTGPLFDFLDTASVVRDMEAIRAALGERRVSFYGRSYGTLLGQQYAERFPDRVRALALDSVVDHSVTSTLRHLYPATVAAEKSVDMFARWCARTPACSLHGHDVRQVLADLHERAARGELSLPGVGVVGPGLLSAVTAALDPQEWPGIAERLASLMAGDANAEATALTALRPVADPRAAIFCQDWALPFEDFAQLDAYRRLLRRVAPTVQVAAAAWRWPLHCPGWPSRVRNPQRRFTGDGLPPILMVNSRYDPATPYEGAVNAARESGAVLLTYDGLGHSVYLRGGTCVREAVDRYLISRVLPVNGARCPGLAPDAAPEPAVR